MMGRKSFILTEAAATIPLIRGILVDVRAARARLSRIAREITRPGLSGDQVAMLSAEREATAVKLEESLTEAAELGVEISPGVRCEALFPFEHRWVGPSGDGKLRRAYFVYSDAQNTITEWYFDGWPTDRRPPASVWWNQFRPGQKPPKPETVHRN